MIIKNPIDRILTRMIFYGAMLGGLASLMSLSMSQIQYFNLSELLYFLMIFWVIGAIWGGVGGLFSGLAMTFTLNDLLTSRFSIREYRIGSGILTFIITSTVFFPASLGLTILTMEGDVVCTLLSWVVIAVICSQIAITKYLRESDVRKRKVK